MPELEVLEAKVPVRTPRLIEEPETRRSRGLAPVAGWLSGPVFSRARDIFAANMTELLDRAEDPARMIRMIILEMEETLVEVRATAARSIADIKEMRRAISRLDEIQADWTAKAELALTKDREDLAKAALVERQKAAEMAEGLRAELEPDRAGAARLRGRHRQAPGQAARSPRPAECDCGAVRERGDPGQGARDHARQPHRRTRSPSSSCSSAAPTSPKAAPRRWASASLEDEIDQLKAAEAVDARAGSHEGRAQGARELKEGDRWTWPARFIRTRSTARTRRSPASARRIGGEYRDRPDLRPHRLRRRRDLHQLQADAARLCRDRHLPRGPEEAGDDRRPPDERLRPHGLRSRSASRRSTRCGPSSTRPTAG